MELLCLSKKIKTNLGVPVLASLLVGLLSAPAYAAYPTAELWGASISRSVPVDIAKAELEQAKAEVAKVKGDPLALRENMLNATARLEQAKANLQAAQYGLRRTLAQELAALSSAEFELSLSKARSEIADINLKAAQVRAKAGAINRLDLEKAETEARNARTSMSQAQGALDIARNNVKTRTGTLPKQKLSNFPSPKKEPLVKALAEHPRQTRADAQITLNKYKVNVMSTDLTAPVELQAVRNSLSSSQKSAEDTSRELLSGLNSAWQSYQNALISLKSRQRSYNASVKDVQVQSGRFKKGLISRVAMLQSRLESLQAEANLDAARSAIESNLAGLAVSANVNVWK